jgi:hypothetical protein
MFDFLCNRQPMEARGVLKVHLHKLSSESAILLEEFPEYFASDSEPDAFDLDFPA